MKPHRILLACLVAAVIAAGSVLTQAQEDDRAVGFSAVVTGKDGHVVRGLTAADFRVVENGRPVRLDRVTPSDSSSARRSIVLLLTGAGGSDALTPTVQEIARRFFDRAGPNDRVSIVRYAHSSDEVAGTRDDMEMRLAEYRAPYGEPLNAKTRETVLTTVAKVSKQLESDGRITRRAIVWIGAPQVFDVVEPPLKSSELLWPYWVDALTAAARADVSLYMLDPRGLTGSVRINPDGLIAQTGGKAFDNSNQFQDAVDRIWQETGSYYRLEYDTAAPARKDLQSIEVKVSRPGVQVRARRAR